MMDKESAEALQETISELRSMIHEALKPVLDAVNAAAKYIPEAPELTFMTPVPLTLEQIKRMDRQTVVIPCSFRHLGGLGVVDLQGNKISDPMSPNRDDGWPLSGYGKEYVAFSINEVPND